MKNEHAVALGKLGGLKGGKARAEKLTSERRKEIADKAIRTRWNNYYHNIDTAIFMKTKNFKEQ